MIYRDRQTASNSLCSRTTLHFTYAAIIIVTPPAITGAIDELTRWLRLWRIKTLQSAFRYGSKPPQPAYSVGRYLRAAAGTPLLRRPRNVLSDPPDALTSEVEKLAEAKHAIR
ncbi:hypothetical protein EVAR_97686_1 [Eumeta japonica]|uniref:Uncharacterized protein n=1 Tax=Eumeta variegata TaxID=151549 RepID=A0A4C1WZ40_EUMVA|nr:hypothetical protein EVAR_97686_1 [Eumeta japonica]